MITVEVVSVGGMEPPVPQSVQIDERGGSAGRSPDCTLVLNDPKRAVSRVHAEFSFRDGGFHVVDQGTNPLRVNGVPLGKGNTSAIRNGDRLTIGPFELEVREDGAAAASARIAPPMSTSQQWAPPPVPAAPPLREPAGRIPPASDSSNVFDDILGIGAGSASGSSQSADSMFEDLGFGAAPTPPSPQPRAATPPPPPAAAKFGSGSFPDDFDPMAPPPSEPQQSPADLGDFEDGFASLLGGNSAPKAPGEGSLDAMFGLSSGSSSGDPFASGPLGKPAPSYSGGTDSGLTQFLGGFNKATAGPVSDHVPELNSAFTPPKAITPTPLPEAQMLDLDAFGPPSEEPVAPPPVVAPPPPKIERPAPPPQMPAARPPMPAQPAPPPPRYVPQAPVATQPPVPTGPAAAPSDLLSALMAGLNAQDLVINELTPELMYKIGTLMHESTAGTIALLNARGSVKREMRADVTMIASGRNNPLKFSPDAKLALRYLFGPQMPGFMEADEAMRDAYADLRAHEFGFMAGLRAALSAVLKRFEPSQIESRLPEKGGINSLVPMNRKGKLWEMFSELYRQIALEAEEDFHALFGREFLRAYEEHIAALERGQQQRRK